MLRTFVNCLLLLRISGSISEPASNDEVLNPKNSEDYCISETFQPSCFENEVIVIGEAIFGRRKLGRCLKNEKDGLNFDDPKVLGCYSDVKSVIDQLCSLRQFCEVRVIELSAEVPCYSYLKYYLEVTWSCIRVVQENRQCKVAANNDRKHILSPAAVNPICGSRNQPWVVETDPGQKILIKPIPYDNISGKQFSVFFKRSLEHESCQHLGRISEKYGNRETTICLSENGLNIPIDQQVFISNASALEIILSSKAKNEHERVRYILSVEATGCSDLIPPADAWLKRTENEATIGCYSTRLRWQLKCLGQRWIGVIGNCSRDGLLVLQAGAISQADGTKKSENQVVAIAIIITVGMVLCFTIACVGIVLLKRYYALRKSKACRQGANIYDPRFIATMNGTKGGYNVEIGKNEMANFNPESKCNNGGQYYELDKSVAE